MRRLSAMDANFLYMEAAETPMHAVALQLFELPPDHKGGYFERLRDYLAERIHLIPYMHQHLRSTALGLDHPVWVEDRDFDIDDHVRHIALPEPGTLEQLVELAEQLYPPLLDRSRPLFQYTLIEGLPGGQVALYGKAHHACLDGMASRRVLDLLYSSSPEIESPPPPDANAIDESQPSVFQVLRDAYSHLASQPARSVRALPEAARALGKLAARARDQQLMSVAPRTRFDVKVTDRRRFAMARLPLAGVKTLSKVNGATVNDVVMTLCSAALRRYLMEKNELPEKSLVGFAPVSLRAADDTELNNQVFGMMLPLATDVADPLERLSKIHAAAIDAKGLVDDLRGFIPGDFALLGAPAVTQALFGLASALSLPERMPQLYNVVISNVPGLGRPLYLAGARMLSQFPMSIVQHGSALNMTVMGYNDSLDFGLIACRRAVPDVERIGDHLVDAYHELESASGT